MVLFSSNNKYKSISKEDTPCAESQITEAWMSVVPFTTSFMTNTSEDKWNVLNIWTTCVEKTRTTTTKRTMKIHRAQFPGKVQGIVFVDSIMVLNSLPVNNCWVMRREWRHWIEKQGNIRQTVIQVLCAVFLPECLQLLGKLNDCTVGSGAQGSPHNPMIPLFFVLVFLYIYIF